MAAIDWDTFHFYVQVSNLLSRGRSRWFDLSSRQMHEEAPDCHIALGCRQHLLAKELSEE